MPITGLVTIGTDDRSLPLVAAVAAMALIPGAVMEWAAASRSRLRHALRARARRRARRGRRLGDPHDRRRRRRDGRTVLLGAAFSTMTALLAVHGLATPGVLAGPNGVVAFAGAASLPAGASCSRSARCPGCAGRATSAR